MTTKMNDATTVEWSKDPLTDRKRMVEAMKGFKGGEFPKNPFRDAKVRQAHEPPYAPHVGGEKM